MNRLENEVSPYLRAHASDPVDWRVWGTEAFNEARDSERPIFLSAGYSACHWCHVMQAESFRDPETAALLNERFVPIKVDRELRPDVDSLYMDYVVASTGSGGWPMSVFLTPDLLPMLGGTYFPPVPRGGMPSLTEVALAVDDAWRAGGVQLDETRAGARQFLEEQAAPRPLGELTRDSLDLSADYLLHYADPKYGGFGTAPKFPQATLVEFLCAYYGLNPDPGVSGTVEQTLTAMLGGGIYDQAGGGLARYAIDSDWRVPHFEKMLYDQGLLLSNLAAATPIASSAEVRELYAYAARQTAAFLAREMSAPGGGFYSALSADTLAEEGATYLWSADELAGLLSAEEFELARRHLGLDAEDPTVAVTLTRRAGRAEDAEQVDAVLAKILALRDERPQPEPDSKVLTSWNALAARGLMEAGAAFDDPAMASLGVDVLLKVEQRASTPDGVLHAPDDPSVEGVRLIEDFALTAAACLTAAETTGDAAWLERAERLHAATLELFADGDVLYMVPEGTELPVRPREQGDNPVPSGAATTVENAIRLAEVAGEDAYLDFARDALHQFWALADFAPDHAGRALAAAVRLL